jgi:hypothetical protein
VRPYFAILKDSFREALASRVMLVTLIGIVAVLALLAPFGLDVGTATQLRRGEVSNPERLLRRLTEESDTDGTPIAHLWSLLPVTRQEEIREWLAPEQEADVPAHHRGGHRMQRRVVDRLNDLIDHEEFYREDVWADIDAGEEAEKLIADSGLDEEDVQRRNLLLLAAVFPRSIDIEDSYAFSLTYGTAVVQGPIPLTPTQFEPIFDQILIGVVSTFLGFFGVFGCLLVTAGLIPRTFEPGEISLLLSKPVRRSMLFVVKFFGGCAFTLLYSTVLVCGIWVLLGTRLGYWRHGLLWCIPVYVFLFMIYYAVSAVAGAIWRNSIVALSLVVVFWIVVTVVGVTQEALKENLINQRGIKEIVSVGSEILTVDGEKNTWAWEDSSSTWRKVFRKPPDGMGGLAQLFFGSDQRFLPVYDQTNDRILAVQQTVSRFGGMGSSQLVTGSADDDWERIPLAQLPEFVPTVLVGNDGRIILPGRNNIYQFVGQSEKARQQAEFLSRISGGFLGGGAKAFEEIPLEGLPERADDFVAAINPLTNNIWLFSDRTLQRLDVADDGKYFVGPSREFDSRDGAAVLTVAGNHVLLGRPSGDVTVLEATSLEEVTSLALSPGVQPRSASAASDGSILAFVASNNWVYLFDARTKSISAWESPLNGSCSTVAFGLDNQLLAADGRLAVKEYAGDAVSSTEQNEWSEAPTWVYQMYDYGIVPAWTVLPKPAQLDDCVKYVMGQQRVSLMPRSNERAAGAVDNDPLQLAEDFNPWQVVRDNALFVLVMLSLGCFYISRRDF